MHVTSGELNIQQSISIDNLRYILTKLIWNEVYFIVLTQTCDATNTINSDKGVTLKSYKNQQERASRILYIYSLDFFVFSIPL